MLLLITGSSCSGKSTAAGACADLAGVEVHDQDEDGVPEGADVAWRQHNLETWVRRSIDLHRDGVDLVLAAQSPLGELLATPSASDTDGLAACLLDVADRERWIRLERRDPGRWPDDVKRAFVGWARWHRGHAADPRERPGVLTAGAWPEMRWDRWASWTGDDPRWHTTTIDTTGADVAATAARLREWVVTTRAARDAGTLPLRHGWAERR